MVSTPPNGYNPQPGDPAPPYPVLTGLKVSGNPNGNLAILVCNDGNSVDEEPHWDYYWTG